MYKLRPRHGLCTAFFCGHGYSEAFTANMAEKIDRFMQEDPLISLTVGADCICEACPHNLSQECDAAEKVAGYDHAVLRLCGLAEGDVLRWSDFQQLVETCILSQGRLAQICGDCSWFSICDTNLE
ncbi:DUF1284 domain-containing protein [Ruminococcus sp.]|uniref:DUF1284 domain-containing protein n=1 Tax=Ruminococcus sp. TaxID=41978 RepID=UPI0025CBDA08|nr:DUF1284 domain-containing protein [Ruminococcus sp.]